MKIELFLDGHQVEINKDIDFVLNKQFTDLTDLTSIIVDYSKTIKVPMTPRNNELFNYVYKLEHQVLINEDIISYDPSQKIPMTMTFNGSIVMDGYALLNSVDLKGKMYEINLYGQLGKIFSDLKEKPLKDYIKSSNGMFSSMRMHTLNVYDSWLNDDHSLSWSSTDWTDFFGFAPQLIGNTDKFNTDSYEEYGTGEYKKFVDVINATRGITYADIYVKDGFDVNQYSEFRSYLNRPYVYVDKIIKLVQNEINQGDYDGYTMVLDGDWFNSSNPYYADMCFFPGGESIIDKGDSIEGMVSWNYNEIYMNFPMTYLPSTTSVNLEGYTYTVGTNNLVQIESTGSSDTTACITLNADGVVVRDRVTGVGDTTGFNDNGRWAYYNLDNPMQVPVRYIGIYDENDQLLNKLYLCDDSIHVIQKDSGFLYWSWSHYPHENSWSLLKTLSPKVVVPNSTNWTNNSVSNDYCEVTQYYNFGNIPLNTNKFRFKVGCDLVDFSNCTVKIVSDVSHSNYKTLCPFKNDKYRDEVWNNGATWSSYFRPIQTINVSSNNYRSLSYWTIYDILGNDFNPFTWLIDYVKQFRLFFDIDYATKTITLKSNYFQDITYQEVTVDYSKGVIIEPIVDQYKKVKYGYKDTKSQKGVKYYKNNGVVYGDMDIITELKINNETLSLTPNEEQGVYIPIDMSCLNWGNLNSTQAIKYSNTLYNNQIITTVDKDGKVEYYPFFAFRLSNTQTWVFISDDTPSQRSTGEYCYLEHAGLQEKWAGELEIVDDKGRNVPYLHPCAYIPRFDNYIQKTVELRSTSTPNTRSVMSVNEPVNDEGLAITEEVNENAVLDTQTTYQYDDPMTGQTKSVTVTPDNVAPPQTRDGGNTQTYLYWDCFGVPAEVYDGYLPSNVDSYCIYDRWKNYLNEIFSPNNKKVTCYVRMSYPEYINFKFNKLFVIDDCVFLVNKIIDFNPNSTAPTKVELIQISDVNNLK